MKSLEIKTVGLAISFLVTAGAAQTTAAPPSATAPALLRPSSGEIITINQIYTVEWTPPPPGPLAIEFSGNRNGHVGQIHSLLPDTWTCTGYIINTECRKLNITIPEGATSYVWNLTKPSDHFRISYEYLNLNLAVYIDDVPRGELPEDAAPWYVSGQFSLVEPPRETTTTITTTRTTTTTTTSATASESASESPSATSGEPSATTTDGGVITTETPTDAAVPQTPRIDSIWKLGLVFGIAFAGFF